MPTVHIRYEPERGCGYRKPGGLYFVSKGAGSTCCRLPFELKVCPTCGQGVKFSRGFTWINSDLFLTTFCTDQKNVGCPADWINEKLGLLWVGEKYYTVDSFTRESNAIGISKRIASVPNDFVVGETWIALAHIKAVVKFVVGESGKMQAKFAPGVFMFFRPTAVEYVIAPGDTDAKLDALEKRGFTLVDARKAGDQTKLL